MRKKNVIQLLLALCIIFLLFGASYAFFVYKDSGKKTKVIVGKVHLNYTTETLASGASSPRSSKNSNIYTEFSISGLNEYTKKDLRYGIKLIDGDVPEGKTELNRIDDSFVHFTLTRSTNGGAEKTVIEDVAYDELTNGLIYENVISAETSSDIEHTYKLYMWFSDDVIIGNVSADYTYSEWADIFASIKIVVEGNFIAKDSIRDVRVTLDNDGGISSETYLYYKPGEEYGNLPTPTKNGYIFDGYWSENLLDVHDLSGEAIGAGITIDADEHVYDATPTADARAANVYRKNWKVYLDPGEYRIVVNYLQKTTQNASFFVASSGSYLITAINPKSADSIVKKLVLNNRIPIQIFLSLFDGVADVKVYRKVTSTDIVNDSHTIIAQWIKAKYEHTGNYVFTGSNFVNTEMYLFNEANWERDFYMSFEIVNDTSTVLCNLVCAKNEKEGNPWAGFDFQHTAGSAAKYQMKATVNNKEVNSGDLPRAKNITNLTSVSKVEFIRVNKVLYYSLNNNNFTLFNDYTTFVKQFDFPLLFGAGLNDDQLLYSITARRYFKGTLANMLVKFLTSAEVETFQSRLPS